MSQHHQNSTSEPTVLTLHPTPAGVQVCDAQGIPLLRDLCTRVTLSDGSHWDTHPAAWQASTRGWRAWATPGGIKRPVGDFRLGWHIEPIPTGLVFTSTLINTGPAPLNLRHLDVLAAQIRVPSGTSGKLLVRQTGYQSWSHASPLQNIEEQPPLPGGSIAGPWQPEAPADRFWSPWCTALHPPNAPCLVWGFLTALRALGCIGVSNAQAMLTCVARQYLENLAVGPGCSWESDPLLLLAGNEETKLLEIYARAAKAEAPESPPGTRPALEDPPSGWCSWYTRYEQVREADIFTTAAQLAQKKATIDVIVVDDGYQAAIGDWLTANAKFPSGMATVARQIAETGYRAGLWWAPFIAAENSATWREHPDWFLRDINGTPTLALFNWNTRCYALDLTHPAVLSHLRETTHHLVQTCGFSFLKLDFLYAGALPGHRHDRRRTSIQAYRQGLLAIRQAASPAFLLGCGAPLLPSVGLVDAMRVGPDVASQWSDPDPEHSAPALLNALRTTLARGWMHPHWWFNDPDCVFLSDTHLPANGDERQTHATAALLTGGLLIFSDPIEALHAWEWQMWATLQNAKCGGLYALSPNAQGLATRAWGHSRTDKLQRWLAYFNWSEQPQSATFQPTDWPDLPPGPWEIQSVWQNKTWHAVRSVSLGNIPPHGACLLSLRPSPADA